MLKPKVLIFLAVWRRPEITEICFMGISRLKKNFDVDAFAVISEESMKPLCKKYGIEYAEHDNQPLGWKKNFGLSCLKEKSFDFMLEIGSDDLIKNEVFDLYPWDRDVMALKNFAMIDSETGDCRHLTDRDGRFGVGRAVSRQALEKMNWKLWADLQTNGLDNRSSFALAGKGFLEKRYASPEPLAIDIKGPDNIWPFDHHRGVRYDFEKALIGLSEQETEAIKSLIHVAA